MRKIRLLFVVLAVAVSSPIVLLGQSTQPTPSVSIPRLVSVSGVYQPADGQPPPAGTVVTLLIHADEQGGTPVWQETQNVTFDKKTHIKKAWETTVLRPHGHQPKWVRSALAPESRKQLAAIDLHFHDLRHEAGCRWLELGWPIHHVQEMLGHANLSHTSTYLHASEMGLQESMRRFDAQRGKPVANDPPIEHPLPGHKETSDPDKSTLH